MLGNHPPLPSPDDLVKTTQAEASKYVAAIGEEVYKVKLYKRGADLNITLDSELFPNLQILEEQINISLMLYCWEIKTVCLEEFKKTWRICLSPVVANQIHDYRD